MDIGSAFARLATSATENMMDSNGPTTGKPTATRYMQDAEVRPWIDRVKDRWKTWLVVLIVAIVGIYYLSGRNSSDSAVPPAVAHPVVPVSAVPAPTRSRRATSSSAGHGQQA